jgi:uncharacterized protein YidB (DUF937 family)
VGIYSEVIMGLLDAVLGMGGDSSAGQSAPHQGLMEEAMAMLCNRSSGGLGGLLEKFKSAGLGSQAASWVSKGPNQSVTGDQVQAALGNEQIGQLAKQFGISPQMISGHLAQILPALIDHATPDGQVPASHGLVESCMAMLKGKFFGGPTQSQPPAGHA